MLCIWDFYDVVTECYTKLYTKYRSTKDGEDDDYGYEYDILIHGKEALSETTIIEKPINCIKRIAGQKK